MVYVLMTKDIKWKLPINITTDQWLMLLQNEKIVKMQDLELFKLIYAKEGFMATASQIAKLLNMDHHAPLNSQVGRLGKRITNKTFGRLKVIRNTYQTKHNVYLWECLCKCGKITNVRTDMLKSGKLKEGDYHGKSENNHYRRS